MSATLIRRVLASRLQAPETTVQAVSLAKQGAAADVADPATPRANTGVRHMKRHLGGFAAVTPLLLALCAGNAALAQKSGGILKMYSPDSPASMSIHEEATVFAEGPMMGVFN